MTDKPNSPQEHDTGDDVLFDQYLQGDSQLSRLYKHSDHPTPSAQLDQTILAAARRQAAHHHWWSKPGSWAATIAIVSLAALLAHNTWKTEQEYLQQERDSQIFRDSSPETEAQRDQASSVVTGLSQKEAKPLSKPAEPSRQRSTSTDARKPRYKSAPAPVLAIPLEPRLSQPASSLSREEAASAPGRPTPAKPRTSLQGAANLSETMTADSVTSKAKSLPASDLEARQWLEQIRQLLSNHQSEEARQLYQQFRKQYPDYPVDPVILQQLSP